MGGNSVSADGAMRKRIGLWLCLLTSMLASVPSGAIVVTDENPAYPIGSIRNADNAFCTSFTVPCRLFGVGVVSTRHDGAPDLLGNCTGTPIGPRTILSAAHCFDGKDAGGNVDAASLADTTFYIPGVLGRIKGTPVNYPGYSGAVVESRDIALVILDTPLPSWVPIFRLTSFISVPRGAVVTHVGYGRTGTGRTGGTGNSAYWTNTVNIVMNTIDAVSSTGRIFSEDFDGGGYNRIGGGPLREFGGKSQYTYFEGDTASGDSGGPVFYNSAIDFQFRPLPVVPKLLPNEYEIVGITSYGVDNNGNKVWSEYGDSGGYIFVGAYVTWIKSVSPEVVVASSVLNHTMPPNVAAPAGVASNELPAGDSAPMPDLDADLVHDEVDNCVSTPNYEQTDRTLTASVMRARRPFWWG